MNHVCTSYIKIFADGLPVLYIYFLQVCRWKRGPLRLELDWLYHRRPGFGNRRQAHLGRPFWAGNHLNSVKIPRVVSWKGLVDMSSLQNETLGIQGAFNFETRPCKHVVSKGFTIWHDWKTCWASIWVKLNVWSRSEGMYPVLSKSFFLCLLNFDKFVSCCGCQALQCLQSLCALEWMSRLSFYDDRIIWISRQIWFGYLGIPTVHINRKLKTTSLNQQSSNEWHSEKFLWMSCKPGEVEIPSPIEISGNCKSSIDMIASLKDGQSNGNHPLVKIHTGYLFTTGQQIWRGIRSKHW